MHFRHFMTFMCNKLQCQDKHYVSDSKTTNMEFMFHTISCRYLSLMDLGNLNGLLNLLNLPYEIYPQVFLKLPNYECRCKDVLTRLLTHEHKTSHKYSDNN
jgi:hypothetical protein